MTATDATSWWGEDVVPRIQWRVNIPGGARVPDGYGIAWREPGLDMIVCMPAPINVIARALHLLWLALRFPLWGTRWEGELLAARIEGGRRSIEVSAYWRDYYESRGHKRGYYEGLDKGREWSVLRVRALEQQNALLTKTIADYLSTQPMVMRVTMTPDEIKRLEATIGE